MIDRANIEFIDGYLTSISHLCHGCNFVPVYGAMEVDILSENILDSLNFHFQSNEVISDFSETPEKSKTVILHLLNKWVAERVFEGDVKKKNISTRFPLHQLQSYLLEFIEDIVSKDYKLFKFKIEHDDFGCETEALCFYGNKICVFIYFGWWD